MTFTIELDEATAVRRRVPFRVFGSNGTSPDTGFSTATVLQSVNGGAQVVSANSSSIVSANAGMYHIELTAAEVGALGSIALFVDAQAADFEQHIANVQVVNNNPMSTLSAADVNVAQISADAVAADNLEAAFDGTGYDSGLTVFVKDSIATIAGVTNSATLINALNDIDGSGVTLHAGTHSAATIQGLDRINSSVTIRDADYSAVTVRVDSSVTIAGVTNVATQISALNDIDGSAVTLHAGTHSDVTIQGITNDSVMTIAGVVNSATLINALNDIDGSGVTLHVGTHSSATIAGIGTAGIQTSTFAVGAIDAAAAATDFGQEMADRQLLRDLATGSDSASDGRSVQNALRMLRNRVDASSSVLTVFAENDTSSAWTASVTTSDDPGHINEINPL